ncbi:MAG: TRAP transporter small permease [Deltaproteobacteria bacterium]|nr:TRAP transporter small permease [Deltaproteobacteria bacterium]
MKKIVSFFEGPVTTAGAALAGLSIIIMMVIEFLNAIGRKLYMPFPCCLESAESLMITTVFLGIGYVALKEEHTQVTIITRRMRPSVKRYLDAAVYLFGAITFGVLAWGAWPIAWNAMLTLEIRIGVYRFPIWVFRIFFALGVTLMALQCILNTIKFISQASDPNWKPEE